MEPTVGRIVHFIVNEQVRDAYCENRCHVEEDPDKRHPWCHKIGQSLPFIITGVREGGYNPTTEKNIPTRVSGKILFDGAVANMHANDVEQGDYPGEWQWPPRV